MKRTKRAIAMFLAVLMLSTTCPISAFAEESSEEEQITEWEEAENTEASVEETEVLSYGDYLYTVLPDETIAICG